MRLFYLNPMYNYAKGWSICCLMTSGKLLYLTMLSLLAFLEQLNEVMCLVFDFSSYCLFVRPPYPFLLIWFICLLFSASECAPTI